MTKKNNDRKYEWVGNFRQEQIKKSTRRPGLAAILSLMVMGLGQIYAGHIDRGLGLLSFHIFSLVAGYSVFTEGIVYKWLLSYAGPHLFIIISFLYCLTYILTWIYSIKDAYYLSIFSSFRDWFEVERVLLPSMGVPEELLLSKNGENYVKMLESRVPASVVSETVIEEPSSGEIEIQKVEEPIESEEYEELETPKEAPAFIQPSTNKDENRKQINKEDYEKELENTELVYMDTSAWKVYAGVVAFIICVSITLGYYSTRKPEGSSLPAASDLLASKPTEKPQVVVEAPLTVVASKPVVPPVASQAPTNNNQPTKPVVTFEQLEGYYSELKSLIESQKQIIASLPIMVTPNEVEAIPLIVSADVNSQYVNPEYVEKPVESEPQKVMIIQGKQQPVYLEKSRTEDGSLKSESRILFEDKSHDDTEVVLAKENTNVEPIFVSTKVEHHNDVPDVDLKALEKAKEESAEVVEKPIEQKAEPVAEPVKEKKTEESQERLAAIEQIRERGAYEFYQGNWEAALPFYFEVLKHKRDAESFEMIGTIFEKMDKLSDALEAYENAYKLGSRRNLFKIGLIAEKLEDYSKAQEYLESAIEANPKRADIILSYARCLAKQGEAHAAVQVLAALRDSSSSYAIKKAAEQEFQRILQAEKALSQQGK